MKINSKKILGLFFIIGIIAMLSACGSSGDGVEPTTPSTEVSILDATSNDLYNEDLITEIESGDIKVLSYWSGTTKIKEILWCGDYIQSQSFGTNTCARITWTRNPQDGINDDSVIVLSEIQNGPDESSSRIGTNSPLWTNLNAYPISALDVSDYDIRITRNDSCTEQETYDRGAGTIYSIANKCNNTISLVLNF